MPHPVVFERPGKDQRFTIDGEHMIHAISERALVAQCKSGDHTAFTELIGRNSAFAVGAIRSIASNPTDAEDILQETLLKAYQGLACFQEQCKFSTWLTRIAINCSLEFLRRRKNRVEISLDSGPDEEESPAFQVVDRGINPEQALMKNQAIFFVRKAVRSLPMNLRQYTSRHYFEELPHQETAASLGISLAAGKSRSLRARQRLESSLGHLLRRPA